MQKFKYLIIGGGIAGTTAAEKLREGDHEGSIAIVSDEPHPLYSRVLLSKPNFLLGKQPLDSVWMKKQEWYAENNIIFFAGVSATALNGEQKNVALSNGEILEYDKLLLATGTHHRKWQIPGADKEGIYYLRTLDHAKAIIEALKSTKKHALMIGSACVTFEIAEILRSLNIEVTEVMRENYFWEPALSEGEGRMVEKVLINKGVNILRNTEVTEVLGGSAVEGVVLKDGTRLECDMIFCFIGVVLPLEWLQSSGIKLDRAIVTNEYLETSIPDVWAAGDTARYNDILLHETVLMGNWMNAREQGATAAYNMLGGKKAFSLISFHSSHGFGDMVSFAGDIRNLSDRTYAFRGDQEKNSYGRLIIHENKIIGATMVNRTMELNTIVSLISHEVDVSGRLTELSDEHFDLKQLLPNLAH